jgi:hypothetical protein
MLTALPELLKIKLSGEGFFDLNYDSFIAFAFGTMLFDIVDN